MIKELKRIFSDSYVLVIFFLGSLLYPLIYGAIYHSGMVDEMPVAVVDQCASPSSRRFIRKLDATREVQIAARCADMQEAEEMMRQRKVKGIVLFPSDYDEKLAHCEQATVSTYADMGSFMYYKDLTMATNHVLLDEMQTIETERYSALGMDPKTIDSMVEALAVEENNPYNTNYNFLFFFLAAAVILVVQQTMFFGMSVMNGTMRERRIASDSTLLGRAAAYWVLYIGVAVYGLWLVPYLFGMPQRCSFAEMLLLIVVLVAACVSFSLTFSRFVRHRETAFVVFIFMTSICFFVSGTSWPVSAMPAFWRYFGYLFPSTFGIRAFSDLSIAGCSLEMIRPELRGLIFQFIAYGVLSFIISVKEKDSIHLFKRVI